MIVGAGPAGLATAIAARLRGMRVAVADCRKPPIDKACGEGLLPQAIGALDSLGVELTSDQAFPFRGIRFLDDESRASAHIPGGGAYGVRRTELHKSLFERASELGVTFHWNSFIHSLEAGKARVNHQELRYKFLVGADGLNSMVRNWAGLKVRRLRHRRFGFRQHYAIPAWTDMVEVHWAKNCQIYVTPTGRKEVCVSVLTRDRHCRVDQAIKLVPEIADRLGGARATSSEIGALTLLQSVRDVVRGNVALVGDASGSVDGIAGLGLSLAFEQALSLADAMANLDLSIYRTAHRRIMRSPVRITRLLLLLDHSPWLRRKTLRLFAEYPAIFSRLMSIHTGAPEQANLSAPEIVALGWRVLGA